MGEMGEINFMPSRNWNTDSFMPDASPELTEIINSCTNPTELRERILDYYQKHGVAVHDQNRNGVVFTGKDDPEAHQFSRVVHLPSGRRVLIDGCRSQQELDQAEQALRNSRQ
jgi:hypothetical protein